jgi:putative ABC transport system permease protein
VKTPWSSWRRHRDARDAALDEEIRGHLAMAASERIERGEPASEALAAARREFGNVGHIKEVTREVWGWNGGVWLDRLVQDLRYAGRSLRRAPGFAFVAVLTLALGIGANAAMFTVMNGVLLRPLPFVDPDRLDVVSYMPPRGPFVPFPGLYDLHYLALLKNDPVFERVTTYSSDNVTLSGAGEPVNVLAGRVTASFFGVLGTPPAFGRGFAEADVPAAGDGPVVILSDGLWRSRFGADSGAIGRTIMLDGTSRTVVGVMPRGFSFPSNVQLWIPTAITTSPHELRMRVVIGRLKPGLTHDAALAAFTAVSRRFELAPGMKRSELTSELPPLKQYVIGDARRALFVFAGAVGFVLLIACANVANLLLMRVASRDHEIGIRAALGASRVRIVRQLLTEAASISLAGAVLGIALALAGVRMVLALAPNAAIPRADNVHLDATVLLFTVGLSLVTTILCGLAPALHATENLQRNALAEGSRSVTVGHSRLRSALVVAQIALALVLLTGAGLMLRSFHRMRTVDLGFHPAHVLAATVDLPNRRYATADAMRGFDARVLGDLARLGGTDAVAAINWLPMDGALIAGDFHVEGQSESSTGRWADKMVVSPDYFRTMGIRIERGRAFDDGDRMNSPKVVILSRALTDRFWPHDNPIGKRITVVDKPTDSDWLTIVGVVNDVVQMDATHKPDAAVYQPIAQTPQPFFLNHVTFVVRPTSDSPAIAAAMRGVLRRADPALPLGSVIGLGDIVDGTMLAPRFQSRMLLTFALIALGLAMIGIYGVLAYGVTQRRHEIGVRIALGATSRDVVRMVLRRSIGLIIPGLTLGLASSFAITRVLAKFLFEVAPTDPVTFIAVSALLASVAIAAGIGPARRASRVDPLAALRQT